MLYDHPELYDALLPGGAHLPFYAALADRQGGPVLELACGTAQIAVEIAARGHRTTGLDLSASMLRAARERADAAGVELRLVEGDMRRFELGERFGLVFIPRNSLLHCTGTEDILAVFHAARRHLAEGGVFAFDVFNPDVRILATPPGRRSHVMTVPTERWGEVTVEAASDYDTASQVNRATWFISTASERDRWVEPLHLRSIFPQELPLLLERGGFRLLSRHGDFAGTPFASDSPRQVCLCCPG
ncbi:MAG TPA: class I SAM-dependent methyltransferase [Longimicrobium sp.]|nr:class I SAM-dependent methyltransferase [Longimicrobium sp.]